MTVRRPRPGLLAGLVVALLVQAVVLYAPQQPGTITFPNADKVVHVGVFLVPTVLALAAGLPWRPVVGLLAAHAVVSEVVQAQFLPGRAGDPLDALADASGVVLGSLLVVAGRRRRDRRRSGGTSARW